MLELSLIKMNAIRWPGAIIYYASLYKVVPMATAKLWTYFTLERDIEFFLEMKNVNLNRTNIFIWISSCFNMQSSNHSCYVVLGLNWP